MTGSNARSRLLAITLLMLATIWGCDRELREVTHPQLEVQGPSSIHDTMVALPQLLDIRRRLGAMERVAQIGELEGRFETLLGNPTRVVPMPDGSLLVLDQMAGNIRSFDPRGKLTGVLVSTGGGPNEMQSPLMFDVVPDGWGGRRALVVASRARIKVFEMGDSGLELRRTLEPPETPLPGDMCARDGRMVVRSAFSGDGDLIVTLPLDAGESSAFGTGYRKGGAIIRQDLSNGPVACLSGGGIVSAFTYLPTIMAFDRTGSVRWSTHLPGFTPLTFREMTRGRRGPIVIRDYKRAGDRVLSLNAVPGGALLVQVGRLDGSQPSAPATQRIRARYTYIISDSSGDGALMSATWPQIVGVTSDMIWFAEEAPGGYPRLAGYRY